MQTLTQYFCQTTVIVIVFFITKKNIISTFYHMLVLLFELYVPCWCAWLNACCIKCCECSGRVESTV